jgi:lipoprotein
MFRRIPALAATSLAALTIGLSACSSTTPATPPSTDQQTASSQGDSTSQASGSAQKSPAAKGSVESHAPDPELASKLLTGEVAGITLNPMENIPDMGNAFTAADIQVEPAGCDRTGITEIGAGAYQVGQGGTASVLLSSDTTIPGNYKQYAQKCASISGTAAGAPLTGSVEEQQAPAVDGATDVFASKYTSESTVNGQPFKSSGYLVIGNVNGTTVIAQSLSLIAAQEPSMETATELFKAQAEKLKG